MAPVTFYYSTQGFPLVLWTWGGGVLKIWWGGGLNQNMREAWEELKMLSKTACEGVHLILKLLAISLQASKFAKNELLHTYFSRILARFEVAICAFSRGLFLSGGRCPMGGIGFRGGFSKKNCLKKTLPQLFSSISFWSNAFLSTRISCKKKLCHKHNT